MHKSTSAKMGIGMKLERCFSVVLVMVLCEYFFYCGRAGYEPCTVKKGFPKLYNCRGKFNDGNGRIADVRSLSSPTRYKKVWLGMLIVMEGEQLLKLLNKEANVVDHVEVEGTFRISNNVTEVNPPWGLDRIDRLPGQGFLNNLFKVASAGNGVHVYVVDTGIRCTHQEFWYQDGSVDNKGKRLSRCLMGFDAIGDGWGTADCNGHGTHCAGIIAGLKSGVAKNAFIHPIRAMSCDGSGNYGSILASLEWIGENAILPAVVSMSIATKASISIDQMVDNLVNNYGVVAVAASGNFLQDACNYSPSRANSVISVGSSNVANTMSWFSNYGNCTTIFAPGELIASSYNGSDTDFATLSGTSMACPHVAGAAALYLGLNVDASPSEVRQIILDSSEPNAIGNVKPSTTTKLLNVNMKDPIVDIHPRSIYNGSEGVTYSISISLKMRPLFNVFLTPYLVNTRIGYFQPVQIVFNTGSSWSTAQTIKIVFVKFSDFLDQTSVIQWLFTSRDPRFALSPAGVIVSHDTDVCQKTSTNSCGQTANTPKVIPSLPFYYVEDSNLYENVYDSSFDKCHSSGPDVVFQYTAPSDMIISASLCGDDSQFDTMLSIYEKRVLSSGATVLNQVACNDDYCNIQSSLSNVSLLKGHVYVFMVDGYEGDGGLFDFHVIRPTEAPISSLVSGKIATSAVLHKTTSIIHEACTSWTSRSCSTAPRVAIPDTNDSYFWKVVSWGPCDKTCGGGKQDSSASVCERNWSTWALIHTRRRNRLSVSQLERLVFCSTNARLARRLPTITSALQVANLKCYSNKSEEMDDSYCSPLDIARYSQDCNMIACLSYNIYEGPWSECTQTCGLGKQTREVICLSSLGHTASPKHCQDIERYVTEQDCNPEPCGKSFWEVPIWNFCNRPCSGGKKIREMVCLSMGKIAPDQECSSDPPITEKICNTQPCQTYAWLVGPWEDCTVGCNSSTTRVVECVDGSGAAVQDHTLCDLRMKPATTAYCQHIDITCDDCGVNCTGNGVCMNGTCSCSNEWDGKYCDRPKACQGSAVGYLQDQKIGCCPHSAVDVEQRCCLNVSAVLDVDGKCCESGILDSCGICDGLAISVDVQNECCATVRDEKGICCQSGLLDGCHVCDGDDVSCATNATITTLMNNTLGMPHNASHDWTMFISYFISTVASKLGIDTQSMILNAVQVEDVVNGNCENDPDPANGCLIAPTSKLIGIFNFIILPVPSATLQGMHIKKEALISTLLRMNETDEIATGAKIISVSNVQRVGVCGNGVCEKGERCNPRGKSDTSNSRPCCLKDCPYVISSCPSPQNGSKATVACSGNGICLDASGQCDCFKGYTGSDCLHCTVGWTEIGNGICIQIANTSHTLKFSTTYGQNPYHAIPPAGQLPHFNLITTHILKTGVLAAIIASAVIIGLVCLGLAVCAFKLRDRPNSDESGSQATIQPDEVNRTEEDRDSHMEPVTVTWTQTFKEEQAAAKNSLLLQPKIVTYAPTKTSILMESTGECPSPITPTEEGTVSKWRKSLVSPWGGGGLSEWKKVLLPKQMQQPYELVGIVSSSSSSSSSAANFDPHEHPQQAAQTQGY